MYEVFLFEQWIWQNTNINSIIQSWMKFEKENEWFFIAKG